MGTKFSLIQNEDHSLILFVGDNWLWWEGTLPLKNIRDKKYDFLLCFLDGGGSNVLNAISLLWTWSSSWHVLGCIHKGDCEVDCSSAKTQWEEENIMIPGFIPFYVLFLRSIPSDKGDSLLASALQFLYLIE